MTKTHCEVCDRNFKNEEALEMHNNAMHKAPEKPKSSVDSKKVRSWAIFIIVIGGILALVVWSFSSAVGDTSSCKTDPVTEINIGDHSNLALHIHPELQIMIDGIPQPIPSNIGVQTGVMRPLHTHDSTGVLHVEGPCQRDFTIGEFFQIWDQTFTAECIFDKCTSQGTLEMTVNGVPNSDMQDYEVRDLDKIVITYTSN